MSPKPLRSLVIAPQWIGDAVMTEPLLRLLAGAHQNLSVAALPWVAPIYRAMPVVKQVIELPFAHGKLDLSLRLQLAKSWRGAFDRAYILPNSFKSALLPWLAGIPERFGYLGEARWGLINHALPNADKKNRPPMVQHYAALAQLDKHISSAQPNTLQPHLTLNPQVRDYALQALDLSDKNYTVLVPGAEYGPAKRWPAAHFAKLAALIGQDIVLLGSTKEYDLCQEIEQLALSSNPQNTDLRIHNIAGKTTLDSALAVISGAQAVISNDSGLMHVAAALQVPQIAVFGSSSPLHTPPLSEKAHILWLAQDTKYTPALECAPCFARICPLGHTRCLQDLSPQRVYEEYNSLLHLNQPIKNK